MSVVCWLRSTARQTDEAVSCHATSRLGWRRLRWTAVRWNIGQQPVMRAHRRWTLLAHRRLYKYTHYTRWHEKARLTIVNTTHERRSLRTREDKWAGLYNRVVTIRALCKMYMTVERSNGWFLVLWTERTNKVAYDDHTESGIDDSVDWPCRAKSSRAELLCMLKTNWNGEIIAIVEEASDSNGCWAQGLWWWWWWWWWWWCWCKF